MMRRSGTSGMRIAVLCAIALFILLSVQTALAQSMPSGGRRDGTFQGIALQSISAQAAPGGDVGRGRDLSMGNIHLKNGGPPCMGCHNIASNGILGGGAMGPDLTNVSTRYSEAGLAAVLVSPGPIMKPIFAEHPLTTEEQADLLAFLRASAGQPETNKEGLVFGISLMGLAAAIGVIAVVFRQRLHGVRRPMVEGARSRKS